MSRNLLTTRRMIVLAVCTPVLLLAGAILLYFLPTFRKPAVLPVVDNAPAHIADAIATIGYGGPADGRLIYYESDVVWDGTHVKDWVFFVPAGGTTLDRVKPAVTSTSSWLDRNPERFDLVASIVARRIGIRSLGTVTRVSDSGQWKVLPNGSAKVQVIETPDGLIISCNWIWLD